MKESFVAGSWNTSSEPDRAISEMYRILKPGGYACVIVPSPNDMIAFYDDYTHVRPYTPASLKQLAEGSGFKRYRIECLPWVRGITTCSVSWVRALHTITCTGQTLYARKLGLVNRNNLMLEAWR